MRLRRFVRSYGRRFRKAFKRRMYARRLGNQNKVYSFKRHCALSYWNNVADVPTRRVSFISNSSTQNQFGYFTFRLDDLNNYADFTGLYEKYKITGVKLKFIPTRGDGADVNLLTPFSPMSLLAIAINRGSTNTTALERTFDQILEQQDARIYSTQKPFSIYIPYPKFYAPADGLTVAQEKSGWLQSRHPDVDHYGLQFAWQFQQPDASSCQFRVFATYYIKCANPQ